MNRKLAVVAVLVCGLAMTAAAQPQIYQNGIVNGASFAPVGLPNANIAQGSIFSIFGTGLGPAQSPTLSWPLKTCDGLGGVRVNITAGGQNFCAVMLVVSPGQINAILPSNVPVGQAAVTVTYNNQTSAPQNITVVRSSPGVFTRDQSGSGPGIVTNWYGETAAQQPLNTVVESGNPGNVGIIWATGLGPVTGGDETQTPLGKPQGFGARVFVGGVEVPVEYQGRSGCCAGVDQIVFRYPANVTGCYVPVYVRVGDIVSPGTSVSLATPQGRRACSDPLSFGGTAADQVANKRIGSVSLSRISLKLPAPVPGIGDSMMIDSAGAVFERWTGEVAAASHGQFGVSAFGACTAYWYKDNGGFNDPAQPVGLDAGNPLVLTLPGAGGTKNLNQVAGQKGIYAAETGIPGLTPPWLTAGNYRIDVPGGADVQRFNANLNVPTPLVWTNADAITTVNRAQGLPMTWSGGDPSDTILINGSSSVGTVGAGFYCITRNNPQQFTVPAEVLLSIPATGTGQDDAGSLMVGNLIDGTRALIAPTPGGLDVATFTYMTLSGKDVKYQ